ncbi:MAG: hypothetical protein DA408_07740 [Bacteroidetes bacterium]|nr:MAG: hypothetical protein C7N36_03015 [Bacteroidota bacterium]PTM13140.1 MAG: hypothetical protein DA408_07740 [Bacteroidota bacterium]
MTPIIYLTFANDPDAHLALLKEESRRLNEALEELDRKEYLKLLREESAQVEDIFAAFTRNKDRIAIFHYAGHAGGTALNLEGGSGQAEGLAQLLGQQQGLQLVFLNGCSSKGQVKGLLAAGVPAVIATSVPIEDRKATEFAQQFYEALANRRTIGQAFKMAQAYLNTRYSKSVEVVMRDAGWVGADATADNMDMPWGLYTQDTGSEAILNWKLPFFRPIGLPPDMIQYIGKSFTANRYIVLVLDEMCKYNPDIYAQMVEQKGEETVKKDSKHFPWLVIENFPWPIGSQIRLLRFYDKPNLERLEHLLSTYIITSQLLYYILLSDLWEQARQHADDFVWKDIKLDKQAFANFDFLGHIPRLYPLVAAKGVPFIGEFAILTEALASADSPLTKAHVFLEDLRGQLATDPPTADLDKLCVKTEQAVSIVLRAAAFLARYRMLTVRNVSIEKPRFEPLAYELDMGPLNATQGTGLNLYQDARYRRKENYSDSCSIVLVSNENHLDQSLNLSPFVMDKNTFVKVKKSETTEQDRLAHIFLMGWEEDDQLIYLAIDHSFTYALNNPDDQVNTAMTQDDFVEGRNLAEDRITSNLADDFGADFGLDADVVNDDSPKVFQQLYDQYVLCKNDLIL